MEEIYYPLTTSQHLMMLSEEAAGTSVVTNLCMLMHFMKPVDHELLLQAATLATMRNKTASIRLTRKGNQMVQYFSDQPPLPIVVRHYEIGQEAMMSQDLNLWRQEAFPNAGMDVQLFSVIMLQKPDGLWSIFFRFSNTAFDTYVLMNMAADTLHIYNALKEAHALPAMRMDPFRNYAAERAYLQSPQFERDIQFWQDIFRDAPSYSSLNPAENDGDVWKPVARNTQAQSLTLSISAKLVERINICAREMKVSPQVFYLLAVRACLSSAGNGQEDITFTNTLARRATLEQKRAGGTMVQAVLFRMNFSNQLSFRDACVELHHLQYLYYAHAALPMGVLVEKCLPQVPLGGSYGSVGFSFQPFFLPQDTDLPVRFEKLSSGASTMPLMLNVFAADASGALVCHYDYQTAQLNEEMIHACHRFLLNFLQSAVEHPDESLDALMKMS